MSLIIMLIPTEISVGLTSISLGIVRAIERKDVRLSVFTPIVCTRTNDNTSNQINGILYKSSNSSIVEPLKMSHVEYLLSHSQKDALMEKIIANYHENTKGAKIILVEGLVPTYKQQCIQSLNYEIAKALNAKIVFIISQNAETPEQVKKRIKLICSNFGGIQNTNIIGVIINKLNAPIDIIDRQNCRCSDLFKTLNSPYKAKRTAEANPAEFIKNSPIPVLGIVPWSFDLIATRVIDIAHYLNAIIINKGDINTRRVKSVTFCAQNVLYMLKSLRKGSLLVTSSDRYDALFAACLTAMNSMEIGAILLTDGYKIDIKISGLCKRAFSTTRLPILTVKMNIFQTFLSLQNFNPTISVDDQEHIEKVQEYISNYINNDWIKSLATGFQQNRHLSPSAFRYQLTKQAQKANKRIILPEGNEPRTVKAAAICAKRGIATCILLGNPDEINQLAESQDIKLDSGIEIINPDVIRKHYVNRLLELRKNKGITPPIALNQLEDNVVLGTLMLEQGEVDGLVSGAVHTTANTIRPPLQLIKTAPGNSLVSSIFFMLLPNQVYVYGDCAINPNPTAEQLAEIAIQSANSAKIFGIDPRVAMLSYSTGNSSTGSEVEKVYKATRLAQEKRPDLIIDGPLQYDAAVIADVAKFKAPNSPVAGRATVFIFPDLNTGNITYKAVQRSAELTSIGPILQGMRKPVNDLSRGALVDDIVYTIAVTAIQAM